MEKIFSWCAILTISLLAVAQDAPKQDAPKQDASKPDGESRPRGEGRMQMRGPGTAGTITAIDATTITLKTFNGGTATVKLSDQTKFSRDRHPAKLADFKMGDRVVVRGEEAGGNTYTAQMVAGAGGMMQLMAEGMGKQFIAGKVEKIDELKLIIARIDGPTQVIEVDENTSFRKQGESITLADIKVGDQVMGRGALKDGVFVPAVLNVGQFPQVRMAPGGNQPEQKKPEPK